MSVYWVGPLGDWVGWGGVLIDRPYIGQHRHSLCIHLHDNDWGFFFLLVPRWCYMGTSVRTNSSTVSVSFGVVLGT